MKQLLIYSLFIFLSVMVKANNVDTLPTKVFVMEIRDDIDSRMLRYVEQSLEESLIQGADLIIIDMDTYGGGVKEADDIVTLLLKEDRPIYVFINKNAGSAGSFISIACDSIYMSEGSSIGASTVVNQDGEVVPEKYQSFMRTKMRSTAETKGRDPKIAEGMVGRYLQTDSAYVISFTPTEAIEADYCEGKLATIEEILAKNNIEHYTISTFKLDATEQIIAFFLNPVLKSILILLIMGGIYFELQSPGVGFPLIAAVIGAVLYFVPDYLHGLLDYKELLLFALGIVLVFVEVFITPGFGVLGILGVVSILTSLVLSTLNNDGFDFTFVSMQDILNALTVVVVGIVGAGVFLLVGGATLSNAIAKKDIALQETIHAKAATTGREGPSIVGQNAVTHTVLRPSGKIKYNGLIYDAYTRGEFIEKEQEVVIIAEERSSYIVKLRS